MAQCYPKIKDYCREKHGLEFQVNRSTAICKILHIKMQWNRALDLHILKILIQDTYI